MTLPLLLLSTLPLYPQQPASYRDPGGRFTVQTAPGWTATALNSDAVQFSSGSAYATLMVLPGDTPGTAIDAIGRQTGGQWRNFNEARRGDVRMAGRGGTYVTYSGTNPRGVDSYLELMAVADNGRVYLLMMSAPKADFARVRAGFDRIEQSLVIQAVSAGTVPPTPAQPAADAGKPTYYRMKKASLIDERGFERPMPVLTLLIPTDWKFRGEAKYQATFGGCHENTVQVSFQASSPDRRLSLEMFPNYVWQWVGDPGMAQMMQANARQAAQFGGKPCDVMPAMSAADYLRRAIVPTARPRAQVAAVEAIPEVLQQAQEQARQYEASAARMGMRMQIRADAGRLRLQYTLDGQAVEEWLTAVTYAAGVPGPSYNMRTGQMGQTLYYSNGAYMVMAMRAPQGQLPSHEKFFNMVRSTMHADPQWVTRVQQVLLNMQAADTKGAADRSRIIAQSGREISDIINKGYQERSERRERAVEKFDQYIRGVGTYRNPQTGETFELPYYYNHAWVNGASSEYVVSDSGFYNPNGKLPGNWTEVVPVK